MKQIKLFSEILYKINTSNKHNFFEIAFSEIEKLIPFDNGTAFTGTNKKKRELISSFAYKHPENAKSAEELFNEYEKIFDQDFYQWLYNSDKSSVQRDSMFINEQILENTIIYKKILKEVGVHYAASIILIRNNILLGTLNFFRKKDSLDFSDIDLSILESLMPHIEEKLYQFHDEKNNILDLNHHLIEEYNLTNREIEILYLVSEGLSNKEIADKLDIEETTIKKHIQNLFIKLKVDNRYKLITYVFNKLYKNTK